MSSEFGLPKIRIKTTEADNKLRKRLFAGTVPANMNLFAGTVPANKNLLAGAIPANKNLFAGTCSSK